MTLEIVKKICQELGKITNLFKIGNNYGQFSDFSKNHIYNKAKLATIIYI